MTTAKINFVSQKLKRKVEFNLIFPSNIRNSNILLLLHGRGDNEDSWINYTNVIRYNKTNMIILPAGDISFYYNRKHGEHFEDFLIELIFYVRDTFNLKDAKINVAGNSMGGHGSLHLGLSHPSLFNKIGLFSPAIYLDENYLNSYPDTMLQQNLKVHSYKIPNTLKEKIYLYCGTQDFLYEQSKHFSTINDVFLNIDNYGHEWDAWDKQIKLFLEQI